LSDNLIKGFQLLYIKEKHTIPNKAFNKIMSIFGIIDVSLYKLRKSLKKIVPLQPKLVDICWNSCCAFIGENANHDICPICREPRYVSGKTPKQSRKSAAYFSIIDSLKIQYKDPSRATILRYRHEYTSSKEYNNGKIGDVFDGNRYKSLVASGLFPDYRDVALIGSTDGYQLFRQKRNDCWIVLLLNANLPPSHRVKKENLMITAVIPGPKSPKDFNSFLQPLINELKHLEGNIYYFNFILLIK
jgi:hypothetical protein